MVLVMINDFLFGVVIRWCGFLLIVNVFSILWVFLLIKEMFVLFELSMVMILVCVVCVVIKVVVERISVEN